MDGLQSQSHVSQWSLSLIIPAWNEAAGIRPAIDEADEALATWAREYEIIVVDDGSWDSTTQEVTEAAKTRPRVRLVRHPENQGYGAALRSGFEAAQFDRVAFTDADCQFYLADLASLVPLTDRHPVVVGYRLARQDPWRRRFFSRGYNWLSRTLLGTRVRDCDCALKVFRKEALQSLLPRSQGFFVNTEMLTRARQLGFEIGEMGVRHRPRTRGASKVSLWDIPRTLRMLLPFWWTEELFTDVGDEQRKASIDVRAAGFIPAGTSPAAHLTSQPKGETSGQAPWHGRSGFGKVPPQGTSFALSKSLLLQLAILVFCAGLLFFARLGCPLQEPEESRYAEIPRQMLNSGNWIVPVLHGEPYYDKPPLLYWMVMTSYRVFGVADWSARLISASAAFLTVLVTYLWGRRVVGSFPAFLGAAVLCLSARYVYLGRLLTMNSLLCLCVVTALAAGHSALHGRKFLWRWWVVSALACGMGLLAKGPVALVLVLVPFLAIRTLDHRTAKPGWAGWFAYVLVSIGVAAPWYIALAVQEPGFLGYFIWKHNLIRYVAPFDHAKPVWYYLGDILLGMLPWSLLLPSFLRYLFRRVGAGQPPRPAGLGLIVISALWSFVFYSLAGSKRAGYILPAMPPLALALGCYLDAVVNSLHVGSESLAILRRQATSFALRFTSLVIATGLVLCGFCFTTGYLRSGPALLLTVSGLASFIWAGRFAQNRDWRSAWSICGIATFVVLFGALYLVLPGYARRFSMRGQVRPHFELARDRSLNVVCYPRGWDSVAFYLGRGDVKVFTADERDLLIADIRNHPRTLAFVKSERSLHELLRDLPGSLEFVPQGRQGAVAVGWIRKRAEVPDTFFAVSKIAE
jgi:dolichol-phosphate mannosyltransferase